MLDLNVGVGRWFTSLVVVTSEVGARRWATRRSAPSIVAVVAVRWYW